MHLLLYFGSSFSLPVWEEKTLCYIVCYIYFLFPKMFFHPYIFCIVHLGGCKCFEVRHMKGRRYVSLGKFISDFFEGVLRGELSMNRAGDVLPKTRNLCVSMAVGLTLGGLFVGLGTKLPQSKSLQLQRI